MAEELYQLPRQVTERRRRVLTYLVLLLVGSVVTGLEAAGWQFGRAYGHPSELGALSDWPSRLLWVGLGSMALLGLSLGELREERRARVLALTLAGLWWVWGAVGPIYSPVIFLLAVRKLVQVGTLERELREALSYGEVVFLVYCGCAGWCLRAAWRRLPGPGDAYGSARFARRDEVRKREDLGLGEKLGEGIVLV